MRKRPQKYDAQRMYHAGYSFASRGESECFSMLRLLERAGKIRNLRTQITVYLTRARIAYKPDFQFEDLELNETVFGEYKGFETPEWRLKRRLWISYGPGRLRVYKGYPPTLHEEIVPETDPDSWSDVTKYQPKER
jgi:hypothetical protein